MKGVSKILVIVGFSLTSHLLSAAENQEGDVFNLDCTASYTKDGQTESVRPHGTIRVVGGSGAVGLRQPLIPSNYVANLQINIRPQDDVSNWVVSFLTEESETPLKQERHDLLLDSLNKVEMDYSPSDSEILKISCAFDKQLNQTPDDKATLLYRSAPALESNATTNENRDGELDFDHFAVIREFTGPSDNAALFGVLSNQEGLEITSITGPRFLGGARVGTLDASSMSRLFRRTSVPMSDAEKQALVERYQGAKVIYFEDYNGKLCAGPYQIYSVVADGKIGDQITSSNFTFAAVPTQNGNCRFATLSTTTSFHN
jgi:hypothetical protein